MIDREVMPRLRRIAGNPEVLRSRVLRTWGLGESQVAELLDDLFASTNPTVGFLLKDMEVQVRISARAADHQAADRLIEPVAREIRARLGEAVFGADDDTVELLVIEQLSARGWTVSTVEQATLGQVGARLAVAPGADAVYGGTVIVGSRRGHAAVPSTEVVLSVGEIGADESTDRRTTRPVEMSVQTPVARTQRTFRFGGDDERVRSFAVIAALHLLRTGLDSPLGES